MKQITVNSRTERLDHGLNNLLPRAVTPCDRERSCAGLAVNVRSNHGSIASPVTSNDVRELFHVSYDGVTQDDARGGFQAHAVFVAHTKHPITKNPMNASGNNHF